MTDITTVPESKLLECLRDSISSIKSNTVATEAGIEEFGAGSVASQWLAVNQRDVIAISRELERRWYDGEPLPWEVLTAAEARRMVEDYGYDQITMRDSGMILDYADALDALTRGRKGSE